MWGESMKRTMLSVILCSMMVVVSLSGQALGAGDMTKIKNLVDSSISELNTLLANPKVTAKQLEDADQKVEQRLKNLLIEFDQKEFEEKCEEEWRELRNRLDDVREEVVGKIWKLRGWCMPPLG